MIDSDLYEHTNNSYTFYYATKLLATPQVLKNSRRTHSPHDFNSGTL